MKRFCLVTIATLFSLMGFAQEKIDVHFYEKAHNFGTVIEDGGIVAYNFRFINQGDEAIRVLSIHTTCGCTTPAWKDSIIAPGVESAITVAYDPKFRPGPFNREVFVHFTTEAQERVDTLYMIGDVSPRPRTIDERFPYMLGDVQCNCKMIYFKYIFMGSRGLQQLNCYNNSSKPQHMEVLAGGCVNVSEAKTIEPGEVGTFDVTYDTNKGQYGVNMVRMKAVLNGDTLPMYFNVRAEVSENFAQLTEKQRQRAPIIQCVPEPKKSVKKGEPLVINFAVLNNGLSPLLIRRIVTNGDFIVAEAQKTKIKAGRNARITLTIDTSILELGHYKRKILIISNDPVQPNYTYEIEFDVEPAL